MVLSYLQKYVMNTVFFHQVNAWEVSDFVLRVNQDQRLDHDRLTNSQITNFFYRLRNGEFEPIDPSQSGSDDSDGDEDPEADGSDADELAAGFQGINLQHGEADAEPAPSGSDDESVEEKDSQDSDNFEECPECRRDKFLRWNSARQEEVCDRCANGGGDSPSDDDGNDDDQDSDDGGNDYAYEHQDN